VAAKRSKKGNGSLKQEIRSLAEYYGMKVSTKVIS